MIGKESDTGLYFQGSEFFAGRQIDYLWVNAALNYALHMNSSDKGLPCDRTILEIAETQNFDVSVVQWYLRTRRIIIREIRLNSQGDIEFNIRQVRTPLSQPEPDF
ncbi:hypothetical protein HYZ78_00915 [Candidatus Microgenomates bacterium]|nr:hypothetical protein [Candidatus Microgenomates bacterium]